MYKIFLHLTRIIFLLSLLVGQIAQAQPGSPPLPDWALGGFARPAGVNPIISPDANAVFNDPMGNTLIRWKANDTFNPGATIKGNKIILIYRSEDNSGLKIGTRTSRLGYAESRDGISFKSKKEPVLFPQDDDQKEFEWPGGCEDPRIAMTSDGIYLMLYTQWNRKIPRLGAATSKDLIHWKKHGPIFQDAYIGKFLNMATKSAAILTEIKGNKQVIAKQNGLYFMYWGERHVYAATSSNLTDWSPLVDSDGKLLVLASPRTGYFDSDMTECGPPALLTNKGIILLYNGRNDPGARGDKRFGGGSYNAGQMLFDKNDPTKLIARLNVPFLKPREAYERRGQYLNGTVFIEGMAWFKRKWYLYYGCADSRVAVAISDPKHPIDPDPIDDVVR